jgi:hypothetical protein
VAQAENTPFEPELDNASAGKRNYDTKMENRSTVLERFFYL